MTNCSTTSTFSVTPLSLNKGLFKVAAIDYGMKYNIARLLANERCFIKIFPSSVTYDELISFKPDALIKFSKSKPSKLEKIEDIELLRALEIGLKIKTITLHGDSFSVDTLEDYQKAKDKMKKNIIFKYYKE